MQIGLVDVYANHGVLVIGNKLDLDTDVTLQGAAAVSSSHVLLATRGQAGLVRVRLWNGIGPRVGTEVVVAKLELSSQYLFVFDIEKVGMHSFAAGDLGTTPIRVSVDDPGLASRVDVLIGEVHEERELTSVAGHPLFSVAVASGVEMEVADELDLILSGHDLPLNRLAAAIKLIFVSPASRPAILDSRLGQVVEWSRWLTPQQSVDRSHELGRFLRSGIASLHEPAQDVEVISLAERALAKSVFSR
ncbi:hypothetical protein JQS43_07585 [Natronosporangium hydrolyticum]|uniref:Uncharacterized protein n=1 Tax=Natronosporangium hydrolyticum TaxID=2811111 RepID=A0A895YE91_9ACTN|nr:hypothetical protein [Natronosporangium hydrolyticum]QSB16154.1 hypothetical protein JQS43_07585 [Natronosporangium hydrolyticum]